MATRAITAEDLRDPTPPDILDVRLCVNGSEHHLSLDPRTTLLDVLREHLRLPGSKKGCDHGQCCACTALVEGRRINSCLTLAVCCHSAQITKIEGLESNGQLHPMQSVFIACDAFQCGYCTTGQIISAVARCDEGHARTDAEIREAMTGNLCRCGAYDNILAAVRQVVGANKAVENCHGQASQHSEALLDARAGRDFLPVRTRGRIG